MLYAAMKMVKWNLGILENLQLKKESEVYVVRIDNGCIWRRPVKKMLPCQLKWEN